MLYRSFPKRAMHFADGPSSYEREKARLTAVLTVLADDTKDPLTRIGRYKNLESFPRHFDAMKDLGIFYKCQRILGTHQVGGSRQCEDSKQWLLYRAEV